MDSAAAKRRRHSAAIAELRKLKADKGSKLCELGEIEKAYFPVRDAVVNYENGGDDVPGDVEKELANARRGGANGSLRAAASTSALALQVECKV